MSKHDWKNVDQDVNHQLKTAWLAQGAPNGVSDFILPILQPNTGCFPIQKRPVFSQIWRFFSQPEDFIGIYSQIQKAQAVSQKR